MVQTSLLSNQSIFDKSDSLDLKCYLFGDFNCNLASLIADANTHPVITSSKFIGNSLVIYHLKDTLPSLTEIFEILMVEVFEMKCLSNTGR
ncbi:hypothetical protein pdam_00022919 [Pocillopora damicornis]|uniref:Uncharacterized protein n=1 Tax=Pocillopora damicornis TaxID=46731 RepID=A0A3M6V067_POCDA|nr:hypothetical protein pdam_00022919 [Pocillopora damicornis]